MMCLFLKHTHGHHEVLTPKLHIDNCVGGILPEKEHDGAGVVQLVHLVEVWHFCDVHQVNNSEIFNLSNTDYYVKTLKFHSRCLKLSRWHLFSNAVQNFVHFHACWVPVVPKADHNDPVLLRQNGLIDLPAIVEMR